MKKKLRNVVIVLTVEVGSGLSEAESSLSEADSGL